MTKLFNIEYEIEKRLIKGLKAVFEKDVDFNYNVNRDETGVVITGDYPEDEHAPLQKPHIVISSISLSDNTQNTFTNNFMRDIKYNNMRNAVQEYAFIIPYSATILCSGDHSVSKDLASVLREYIAFSAYGYLSETLGLNISSIQKGSASPSKQYPQTIFDTPISIQGTFYHIARKKPDGFLAGIDTPIKDIIEYDIDIKEY